MTRWSAPVLLALWCIAALAVFVALPGADIATSRLFFDGTTFPVQENRAVEGVRLALYVAEDIAALVTLLITAIALWGKRQVLGLTARDWLFGFGVFALGPGLLVNGILKPVWGRARPWRVAEFGGPLTYTQPWQISDQCHGGCSFVSGEMAGAVALAIVLIMIMRANRIAMGKIGYGFGLAIAAALPLVTGWQRIAAGKHFLSDVVFAALFVALLASVLSRLFYPRQRH